MRSTLPARQLGKERHYHLHKQNHHMVMCSYMYSHITIYTYFNISK